MDGERRREKLIELLEQSERPVSGTELAKNLGVSRQVIVQDIALLRAVNKNILSTNKGYIVNFPGVRREKCQSVFQVVHTTGQIQDELNIIVDYGGKVLDVIVAHDIYGQISADLLISSRRDVEEFTRKVNNNQTTPLKELTGGVHYHTVEAETAEVLADIEKALDKKGYLLK